MDYPIIFINGQYGVGTPFILVAAQPNSGQPGPFELNHSSVKPAHLKIGQSKLKQPHHHQPNKKHCEIIKNKLHFRILLW